MRRVILMALWKYFKLFVMTIGVGVLLLLLTRDIGYITEDQFLMILPYFLIIYLLIVVGDLIYDYLIKKSHRNRASLTDRFGRQVVSPLPIIAMVFTSVTVLNSSMVVLGFETPLEGPEAFLQMIFLAVLIAILVGMLLSSQLKAWYRDFEADQLFQRFVEAGGRQLFSWTSSLFTLAILGLGLITLILSITLNIETGLTMHETFIKIYGGAFALGLIARFIAYRKQLELENNRLE